MGQLFRLYLITSRLIYLSKQFTEPIKGSNVKNAFYNQHIDLSKQTFHCTNQGVKCFEFTL